MLLVAIVFFGLLLLGMPVGFVLGVAGMVGIFDMGGGRFLAMWDKSPPPQSPLWPRSPAV